MALVFIGAGDSQISDGARQSAMSIVQNELYPTGINGDDRSGYIQFLSTIKAERDAAKQIGIDDGIVASVAGADDQYMNLLSFAHQVQQIHVLIISSSDTCDDSIINTDLFGSVSLSLDC
jgi:hypothetical protein